MNYKLLFLVLILVCACQDRTDEIDAKSQKLSNLELDFSFLALDESGVDFTNEVEGQENFNVLTYRNYFNGGGVALGDINNDGLIDIYFTANMSSNALFLNKGNLQFEDITESSGVGGTMSWSTGVTMADVDGDGLLDIYVSNSGDVSGDRKSNELFINNGDLTFTEQATRFGLDDQGFSTHASFFDYDRDGDLDMYLLNNSFKDASRIDFKNIRAERDEEGGDKLFRNDGDSFVDVSKESGIYGSKIGFGLGVSVSDINNDLWPDIYISNDFWERDYLYVNQGDGTFLEELTERIPMTSTASMGADIADIDNNGSYEIFSTDMLPATNERLKKTTIFNEYNLEDLKYRNDYHYQYTQNCLQLNNGQGYFQEVAHILGLSATDWSWGALIFDFNNDGLKDIFVSNGVYHDITDLDFSDFIEDQESVAELVKEKGRFNFEDFLEYLPSNPLPNYAFLNQGKLEFIDIASKTDLKMPSFSNGSAYGDLDNDGDLDLVINNVNEPSKIYQNTSESSDNNYLTLSFSSPTKNRFTIGARVKAFIGDEVLDFQNFSARGFQSSTDPRIHIGLGQADKIDKLEITWPSGTVTSLANIDVNQQLDLTEDQSSQAVLSSSDLTNTYYKPGDLPQSAVHTEDLFNDFNFENLAPHMMSAMGPKIIRGDVNNDGTEDFILLGARQDEDKLFIQNADGSLDQSDQSSLSSDREAESTCGLLVDLDGDADLDLMIGSGGNNPSLGPDSYLIRIYQNDGSGIFTKIDIGDFKAIGNFSVIRKMRLTTDRIGIFIGGSIVPGNYGLTPRNYLFAQAGNGRWQDITTQEIGQIGMVTDATAADIDNDDDDDLIVVGEWMPIQIFENVNGALNLKGSVPSSNGLWQSISAMDIDGDGFVDFAIGNWGSNSKLQASSTQPLKMYVSDFDANGKTECLIEWYAPEDDEPSLFATKGDLTKQLPYLKKVILKNTEYATRSLKEIIPNDQLKQSKVYEVNELRSSYLMNRQGFRFDLLALPFQAQLAPIYAITTTDINQDNLQDLVLGGNLYGLKPEIGRMNSTRGVVLKNMGDEQFENVPTDQSGIEVNGEIRDIQSLKLANDHQALLFAVNNESMKLFIKN